MANFEQMMHVANSCPKYDSTEDGFKSVIGAENSKSCENCGNFKNGKCAINLFDKVLTGLDQM